MQPIIYKKPLWVTGNQLLKITTLTCNDLEKIRQNNDRQICRSSKGGGWLYNLNEFPEKLFKKETV